MKLKVQVGKIRLVIPVLKPNAPVSEFAEVIAARFKIERIKELQTADGFIINMDDIVADVLTDGEVILGSDYQMWLEATAQNCGSGWLRVKRPDYSTPDADERWVDVGFSSSLNKTFVRAGKNRVTTHIELFDKSDLKNWAKPGKRSVLQIGDEKSGVRAEVNVQENGTVSAFELAVKAPSDLREEIKRVEVVFEDDGVKEGKIEDVQSFIVPAGDKKYTIPEPVSTGVSFPQSALATGEEKTKKTEVFSKATNDNKLQIEQKGAVEVTQSWARDGVFNNGIQASFELLNLGDAKLIISSIEGHYKDKDEWKAAPFVFKGHRTGFYSYSWDRDTSSWTIEPKTPVAIAFGISIPIKAPQMNTLRRVHSSLTIPLEVKFTLTDVSGGKATISVFADNTNQPLDLPSKAKRIDYYSSDASRELVAWLHCDDLDAEGRHYVEGWKIEDSWGKRYEIRQSVNSGSETFYLDGLHKLAYEATKTNQTEINIPSLTNKTDGSAATVSALVDTDLRRVYAFKFALSTNTSTATQTFPITY